MGLVSFEQGAFGIALALFERVLAGLEKSLSLNHLWTIHTVYNIARAYDAQRYYAAAMFWYERALAGYTKSAGSDTTPITTTRCAMARVLEIQRNNAYLQRASADSEKKKWRVLFARLLFE